MKPVYNLLSAHSIRTNSSNPMAVKIKVISFLIFKERKFSSILVSRTKEAFKGLGRQCRLHLSMKVDRPVQKTQTQSITKKKIICKFIFCGKKKKKMIDTLFCGWNVNMSNQTYRVVNAHTCSSKSVWRLVLFQRSLKRNFEKEGWNEID